MKKDIFNPYDYINRIIEGMVAPTLTQDQTPKVADAIHETEEKFKDRIRRASLTLERDSVSTTHQAPSWLIKIAKLIDFSYVLAFAHPTDKNHPRITGHDLGFFEIDVYNAFGDRAFTDETTYGTETVVHEGFTDTWISGNPIIDGAGFYSLLRVRRDLWTPSTTVTGTLTREGKWLDAKVQSGESVLEIGNIIIRRGNLVNTISQAPQ